MEARIEKVAGKTRVVVRIGGVARELFSASERKGGDVMVFVKGSRSISTSDGAPHAELSEQRFSVHVSPRSAGHTIKQTLKTDGGLTTTSALVLPNHVRPKSPAGLLLPPRPQFCWPVYMARPPRLDAGRYDSAPKGADREVELAAFDPSFTSLVYLLVATSADVLELPSIRKRTSTAALRFGHFNLHVVHGYSPVPSMPTGDFLTFATGPQLVGDATTAPGARKPRRSLGLPAAEGAFFEGLGMLRDRFARQFLGIPEDERGGPDQDEADGAATMMWGLSAFCLPQPPSSPAEIMGAFEDYAAEVSKLKDAFGSRLASLPPRIPDWLELARQRHERGAAGQADTGGTRTTRAH